LSGVSVGALYARGALGPRLALETCFSERAGGSSGTIRTARSCCPYVSIGALGPRKSNRSRLPRPAR
jgi:hypothetical protein